MFYITSYYKDLGECEDYNQAIEMAHLLAEEDPTRRITVIGGATVTVIQEGE